MFMKQTQIYHLLDCGCRYLISANFKVSDKGYMFILIIEITTEICIFRDITLGENHAANSGIPPVFGYHQATVN